MQKLKNILACVLGLCLFYAAQAQPKIVRVEYYIDNDPGYGKADSVVGISGNDISNQKINIKLNTLSSGIHIFGIRAKDEKGAWSLDNTWLFLKPDTSINNTPNIVRIEYYIDKDPGYGKGIEVAINSDKNYPNVNLFVNVSTLSAGKHKVAIRSKDSKGSWSLDNAYEFTVGTAVAGPSITTASIASKTICSGGQVKVGYQKQGTFNSNNNFKVQLSNAAGSFSNPTEIGSIKDTANNVITCNIPKGLHGSKFKIRVVSTNPAITNVNSIDNITINTQPVPPVITPSGLIAVCAGTNVTLTASAGYSSYLWSTNAITQSIYVNTAGSYFVRGIDSIGCASDSSVPANIKINALPKKPVITASITTDSICPKDSITLTSSKASSYLWSTGAIKRSIIVKTAGNYTVTIKDSNGCQSRSDTTKVTYQTCAKTAGTKTTNITATSAILKWRLLPCAVKYKIQYRQGSVGAFTIITTSNTDTTYKLNGLSSATSYEWKVAAVCNINPDMIGAFSNLASFTTTAAFAINSEAIIKTVNALQASLYPNPTGSNAFVSIANAKGNVTIILSDINGKQLWRNDKIITNTVTVPVKNLAAGNYVVLVKDETKMVVLKLVKQ